MITTTPAAGMPDSVARPDLAEHRRAILLDMAEHGIRPTPLNLIAAALDRGVPEPVAVQIAAMTEEPA